jgi:hypothetical protein
MTTQYAFPRLAEDDLGDRGYAGMTLRDYFAGKAMEALVGDPQLAVLYGVEDRIANASYRMADAMLKARSE